MSAHVIPNLSQFTSEGDNRADALCRIAVITDGTSVKVWMCMISEFRLSQTPVAVLKTRVATSQAERCRDDDRRCSQKPVFTDKHSVEKLYCSVPKCCSLLPIHLYWILLPSPYDCTAL